MDELFVRARQAVQDERFEEALEYYKQVINESPHNALAYQGAALASFRLGKIDDAVALSEIALEKDSKLPMPHVILAEAYDSQNKIAMSREEAKIAFELDPDSADVLACYGTFLLIDNKVDDAIPFLEKSIKINPNLYNAYNNLIVAHQSKRNSAVALTYARKMYEIKPSTHNAIRMAIIFLNSKRLLRVLSVVFFFIAIAAVSFEAWSLLIFPFLYLGVLIAVGLYLRTAGKRYDRFH